MECRKSSLLHGHCSYIVYRLISAFRDGGTPLVPLPSPYWTVFWQATPRGALKKHVISSCITGLSRMKAWFANWTRCFIPPLFFSSLPIPPSNLLWKCQCPSTSAFCERIPGQRCDCTLSFSCKLFLYHRALDIDSHSWSMPSRPGRVHRTLLIRARGL